MKSEERREGGWEECSKISVLAAIVSLCGITYSLQAIFFPEEAEKKGANSFDYGMIFSIFELVILIGSPIIGANIYKFNLKKSILIGLAIAGTSLILFGLTTSLHNKFVFLISCAILRIFEGIGSTLVLVATFTIICVEFPDKMAMYTGLTQTLFGIGTGIGPTIGAPLFQLGGFSTPFVVIGSSMLVLIGFIFLLIPDSRKTSSQQDGFGMMKLLGIPFIQLYGIITIVMGIGLGFLLAHLEPHLRQMDLTKMEIALVMLTTELTWAAAAPLWGAWIDRKGNSSAVVLLSVIFLSFSFLLVGPVTFLPIRSLAPIIVGLFLCGIGQAAARTGATIAMLNEAQLYGFTDPLSTAAYVSSLILCFACLGAFIGPSVGGLLITYMSFRAATDFIMIAFVILVIIFGVCLWWRELHPPSGEYASISSEKEKINK